MESKSVVFGFDSAVKLLQNWSDENEIWTVLLKNERLLKLALNSTNNYLSEVSLNPFAPCPIRQTDRLVRSDFDFAVEIESKYTSPKQTDCRFG